MALTRNFVVAKGFSSENLLAFIEVPRLIYQDDSNWVEPIKEQIIYELGPQDPYLRRGERELIVVLEGEVPVARAVCFFDPESSAILGGGFGFFSHFECIEDHEAARQLFNGIRQWFNERNIQKIMGPMSPKITDPRGILVEGEGTPVYGMPYNPGYYNELIENAGFTKAMDMFEYIAKLETDYPRLRKIEGFAAKRYPGLTIRDFNLDRFEDEMRSICSVYNRAWSNNWAFIPLHSEELTYSSVTSKSLLQPEYTTMIELDGECIGFQMVLPDINPALQAANGNPTAFHTLVSSGLSKESFRAFFIGVLPEYRNTGIDAILLSRVLNDLAPRYGIKQFHVAWVLENNMAWSQEIANIVGESNLSSKRYRLFQSNDKGT